MKETHQVTWQQLRERLEKVYKDEISSHGLADLISFSQYKALRQKLAAALDELAYPISDLQFNKEETEWHDVWDMISIVFSEAAAEKSDQDPIPRETLLELKARLLREIDQMTER